MKLSRRTVVLGGGALAVVAGVGIAAGAFALTRTPSRALEPWESAEAARYADPRMRALAYAILAPNPHNRQPWLIELRGESELVVRFDLERRLPETDPFDRQLTIGLGCFLELLRLAAAADGFKAMVQPFPEGEPNPLLDARPIAVVAFTKASAASDEPLFRQVLKRHTNRAPFELDRPVSADALAALRNAAIAPELVGVTSDAAMVEPLRTLTWKSFEVEIRTKRTFLESTRLLRIGKSEINRNPDGIAVRGFFPELMAALGFISAEDLENPDEAGIAQTLDRFRPAMMSGMAYVWQMSAGNSRLEQLAAGRDWLRVHLAATELGLGLQPVSQALQEFDEMRENFAEAHRLLGAPAGGRVQMLGRLGYGPEAGPSPRWPLETRIKAI